jgi:hypothetical protein
MQAVEAATAIAQALAMARAMAKVELATAEALDAMAKASIEAGDPNDVAVDKLERVMADTNNSIVLEIVPGPDGVRRAKIATPLDPAHEPAPRVYAPDDVRNPQHTPSKRQRIRRPRNKEKHGARRTNRQD